MLEMDTQSLEISCPICEILKSINVPKQIFSQKKFGMIKIQVPPNVTCEHHYIVFVDVKGTVKGYEKIDIQMQPLSVEEMADRSILTISKFIQIFGAYGLSCLIHAKIFNYPAYIMRGANTDGLNEKFINAMGDHILPTRYRGTSSITFLEETILKNIKLKDKDILLIDSQKNILQTPWEEKLKFEEFVINKALEIINDKEQFIIVEQEIAKLIKEAEYVNKFLENIKEIYEDDLIEKVSSELMLPKMNYYRLNLIKEFLRRRYSPKLISKIKNKVEEFLNLI